MTEKITAWLKIKNRGNLDFILKSLNWHLGIFDDRNKYNVVIYSEDVDLPDNYKSYTILRKNDILNSSIECRKLYETIQDSNLITPHWKGAYMALSFPYFLQQSDNLIWNCDADDMIIHSPKSKYYFREIESKFRELNLKTISHDLHLSYHLGDFANKRRHHWTLGLNLSDKNFMKKLIIKSLFKDVPDLGWGKNLDYRLDLELEKIDTPYISFITPDLFIHGWSPNDHEAKTIKYNLETNKVDSRLCNLISSNDKHHRCLLIR